MDSGIDYHLLQLVLYNSVRMLVWNNKDYRKTSHISRTLVGNKTVDNSDVVGAAPVGSSFWA